MKYYQFMKHVNKFAKRVLYTDLILWLWSSITSFISDLLGQNIQSYKCNDRTVLLPNFKAVGQTQSELHSLKVENLDACIRPLFANSITYYVYTLGVCCNSLLITCGDNKTLGCCLGLVTCSDEVRCTLESKLFNRWHVHTCTYYIVTVNIQLSTISYNT